MSEFLHQCNDEVPIVIAANLPEPDPLTSIIGMSLQDVSQAIIVTFGATLGGSAFDLGIEESCINSLSAQV